VRSEAVAVVNGGYAPGIYARKKLVYAYAMLSETLGADFPSP